MSDEIVYLSADVCGHYINKIHEISDELSSVETKLNEADQITEINWNGESGQASLAVIQRFNERFKEIDNALSEAMNLISGMVNKEL